MYSAIFVSPVVQPLRNALGIPPTRIPVDGTTFVLYVFPLLVCHFIVAMLVVMPRTRTVRLALAPLVVFSTLRATLSMDMSGGKAEKTSLDINFAMYSYSIAARTLDWALMEGPLVRHLRPANSPPSTIMDAIDLVLNFRGYGWDWPGYRSFVPRRTRPANRMAFIFYTFLSAILHVLARAPVHRAVITFLPRGAGPIPQGSTIFDETLPFLLQYLRASIISVLAIFTLYAALQIAYDICAILGVLVFGQDPAQWPPSFDSPWRSTSLSEFWGHRWHQFLRRTFFIMGGYPLSLVLGRPGIVVGSFLASAILHHIGLRALNDRIEFRYILLGFGMMAPGILAERAFYRLTGKRVGGVLGWLWTITWLVFGGNMIIEGFARTGMLHFSDLEDSTPPVWNWVERLTVAFDAWLHTL